MNKLLIVLACVLLAICELEAGPSGRRPRSRPARPIKRNKLPSAKVPANRIKLNRTTDFKPKIDSGPHSFDYVLGIDEYFNTGADVVFVDYDMEESEIQQFLDDGKIVICYVNVGAWEEWREDAADFPESVLGNDYDGWPGERWLDIRDTDTVLPLIRERYRTAAAKGCQGIDPDNMNGWSVDTGFDISYEDQIMYNGYVSAEAQVLGMMAGMKNDNEQAEDLVDVMDFAVLEQCAAYDECFYFEGFIEADKPVFAVEYTDSYDEEDFQDEVCPLVRETGMSFILKEYDLHDDFIISCLL